MEKSPAPTPEVATQARPAQQEREVLQHRLLTEIAPAQAGIISRSQLYAHEFTRGEVRAQVRARRWQVIGRHCLGLHTGPLTVESRHWVAVLEAGPRAFIDGESALVLGGLQNYAPSKIRVSVPRGAKIRHRSIVKDALRQNTIALDGDTVLRIPLLGLRLCPDQFFAQIEAGLRTSGCAWPDAVAS